MQWAVEQEEAGGEVNFKEGLAFYSSIGILQVREHGPLNSEGWRSHPLCGQLIVAWVAAHPPLPCIMDFAASAR